jgi:hypothetical protein
MLDSALRWPLWIASDSRYQVLIPLPSQLYSALFQEQCYYIIIPSSQFTYRTYPRLNIKFIPPHQIQGRDPFSAPPPPRPLPIASSASPLPLATGTVVPTPSVISNASTNNPDSAAVGDSSRSLSPGSAGGAISVEAQVCVCVCFT